MSISDLMEKLRSLFPASVAVPEDPDLPLDLPSFELVVLAEELEDAFGLRVHARDIVPENFGTLRALANFVARTTLG
jgi:acyl carrier protein